jgi:hypothetical protein
MTRVGVLSTLSLSTLSEFFQPLWQKKYGHNLMIYRGFMYIRYNRGLSRQEADGYRNRPLTLMPYKANEPRRHKIPKARYRIENWAEYDAALRRRGSLTVWVTPEAIAAWVPATTGRRGETRWKAAPDLEKAPSGGRSGQR